MRKLSILVLALAFAFSTTAFAAATKASQSRYGSASTPNITDASNGNTADVSANGDLITQRRVPVEVFISSATNREQLVVNSASTLRSLLFTGGTAGDMVAVYDGISTAPGRNPLLEVEVGTANSSIYLPLDAGIPFGTEIEVRFGTYAVGGLDYVTITYDTDTVS